MLAKVVERVNLSFEEAYELFSSMLEESEVRVAAYLAAIQTKGYTAEELAGFARAMRDRATRLNLGVVCDTCGTGGDGASTINVSTASALVLSCFVRVAKHGNISVNSKSGSANVLEAMGVSVDLGPNAVRACVERTNFAFLFAPRYHRTLRRIMPIRRELGIKSIFNVLGPLTNPAEPKYQLLGVYSGELVDKVAETLALLGVNKALVVHGCGLDEVSPEGETTVAEVTKEGIEKYRIAPEDLGIERTKIIPCSGPKESARRILAVFRGGGLKEDRTFIVLNASLALYSAGVTDMNGSRELVETALDEGRLIGKLEEVRNATRKA